MNVFSKERNIQTPKIEISPHFTVNQKQSMEGIILLHHLKDETIPVVFFDPQYRGIIDKLGYNENQNETPGKRRYQLQQMPENIISLFLSNIDRILIPSGHLFLWIDKFHLCEGFTHWFEDTKLEVVDLITWNKDRLGMGYRSRRISEYLVVLQKKPKRAKGVWKIHDIPDVWLEKISTQRKKLHPHCKPIVLQSKLIEAVSNEGDYIVDPASGSYSVMEAAHLVNRNFIGCDIEIVE